MNGREDEGILAVKIDSASSEWEIEIMNCEEYKDEMEDRNAEQGEASETE
jgi:hypothetical protein